MEDRQKIYEEAVQRVYHHGLRAHVARFEGIVNIIIAEVQQSNMFRKHLIQQLDTLPYSLEDRARLLKSLAEAEADKMDTVTRHFRLLKQCIAEMQAEALANYQTLTKEKEEET